MDCHFSPVDSLPESFPAAWDKLYNADAAHQEQALTSYLALGNSVEMSLRGSSDDSRVTISLVGIAARAGKASLVRLLHAAGAKLQSADPERFQLSEPLEIAAYCMNKDMVALLLDLGANPSSGYPIHAALYDRHRFPAFESVAAFSGVENSIKESARRQEIVKLLIKSGAYPGKPAWVRSSRILPIRLRNGCNCTAGPSHSDMSPSHAFTGRLTSDPLLLLLSPPARAGAAARCRG